MSNVIKIKKSGTIGATPSSLELGELSLNYADGKLFYKDSSGVIQSFSGGGGGSAGIEISSTPPVDTTVLWVDTSDTATVAIPAGGTTGQVLSKTSDTDYDVSWSSKPGLVLIKKQTIGSVQTTVTVSNAFSATYENYRIIINGGVASAQIDLRMQLGATATGYAYGLIYNTIGSTTVNCVTSSNTTHWPYVGTGTTSVLDAIIDIRNPFLSKVTTINAHYTQTVSGGGIGTMHGYLGNTTSYTDFTITPNTGNFSGGTIYVYGYNV